MSAKRYRDYDPFAWIYTRYWGEEFHRACLPVLDRIVLSDLPRGAAVLDLCCGDGRLLETLQRRRFQPSGLDGSEEMLTYARRRVPRAELLLADARAFKLPARFDVVLSTFDALNHVMTIAGLRRVFRNVVCCISDRTGNLLYRSTILLDDNSDAGWPRVS